MFQVLTNFSDVNSSGLAALGVNGGDFLIQLISFILVFLLLKKFAFKPIIKVMSERKNLIESGVKLGEDMKKKSAELEEEISTKLHEARLDADKIISSAQQEARQLVVLAEESAKEKVEQISNEAQERIKRDTAQARKQLEKELVGLISEATEAIIDEKVDAKKDAQLIDRVLNQRNVA
jgi:F-type H+-transporting ATPase subunit b